MGIDNPFEIEVVVVSCEQISISIYYCQSLVYAWDVSIEHEFWVAKPLFISLAYHPIRLFDH